MLLKSYLGILLLLMLLFQPFINIYAQQQMLNGKVTDTSKEPLPGVSVILKGTTKGTITDIDGTFSIYSVGEASEIEFSFLGMKTKTIKIDDKSTFNVILTDEASLLNEIILTVQAKGQRAAISQQLQSTTVSNIVSAEKIAELPDANAAEALGRLPGISLKRGAGEANQVVIRGLSPKYNNITIEGVKMSSLGGDRSANLSGLQSEMLGGIEVSKSLRADMDADALGGTVNFRLAGAPDVRKLGLILEGGYADITRDFNNYKVVGSYGDRFFNKKLGVSLRISHENKQLPSHQFNASYSGAETFVINDENYNALDTILTKKTNATNLTEVEQTRTRTNVSLILDYKTDWWDVKLINLYGKRDDEILRRSNNYLFTDNGSGQNFSLNIYNDSHNTTNWTQTLQNRFKFGKSSILDVSLSYSTNEASAEKEQYIFGENSPYGLSQNWLVFRDPAEAIASVGGADSLNIDNSFLREFGLGYSIIEEKDYDAKIDYEVSYHISDNFHGKIKIGGKLNIMKRGKTKDNFRNSIFLWGGIGSSNRETLLRLNPSIPEGDSGGNGIAAHNFVDHNYNPGKFLDGRYKLGWTVDANLMSDMVKAYKNDDPANFIQNGSASYAPYYEATENLKAAYVMTEIDLYNKFFILPGIRFEKNDTEYSAYHLYQEPSIIGIRPNPELFTTKRSNEMFFPSLNLKYKATNSFTVQGAVYASTTRPSFTQMTPMVYYSAGTYVGSNNPYLMPSRATNYDLGFSFATNKVGLLTVFAFYKEIDDLIFVMNNYFINQQKEIINAPDNLNERLLSAEYFDAAAISGGSHTNLPFNNTEKAYVKGIELSWQTSLYYLPGLLSGLIFDINYSIIQTSTKYPYLDRVNDPDDDNPFNPKKLSVYKTREGNMYDQPASILNVSLGWDYKGFSSRVSYRYQDKTINGLDARYSQFDSYYHKIQLWDVTLKQKINKHFSVYANMTNLSKHVDDYYYGEQELVSAKDFSNYPPGDSNLILYPQMMGENGEVRMPQLPTSSQYYGFRVQLGVRMDF